MKVNSNFDKENRFIIENYNEQKAFSSFLPGISGLKGIPLWAFYVNRGQGICSFGVRDKDNPIMEFFPAYKSYQTVDYTGFRTFIKLFKDDKEYFYEPFSNIYLDTNSRRNKMFIGFNDLEIEEVNQDNNLKTNVSYFILPEENIGALVRKVTIENISNNVLDMEVIDGMVSVIPYGVNNSGLKEIGQTLKAWMSVYNLENNIPFYKLRASAEDTAEVSDIKEGHFYLCFSEKDGIEELLKPMVDPDILFGNNKSLSYPVSFIHANLEKLYDFKQSTSNKIPSAFFGKAVTLRPGEHITFYGLIGHTFSLDIINQKAKSFISSSYIIKKHEQAKSLVDNLTDKISTATASELLNKYCRQTYLDNILRGGYPIVFGKGEYKKVYHVYSRKHGDLERDYNFFVTEPEYYSCGNGNYRDVNQNRRSDIIFNPRIDDFNIETFMNLLQIDGYNPLVVNGTQFVMKKWTQEIEELLQARNAESIRTLIERPFNIGKLYNYIELNNIKFNIDEDKAVMKIISHCNQVVNADYGEGYWSDHWTYNLDQVESYLSIYPDKEKELLFENYKYTFYDSSIIVKPRSRRYILVDNKVKQYEAVEEDIEKSELIQNREDNTHILRTKDGHGPIYKTNLFAKLLSLLVVKYSLLDPMGMGIEMEGGKPGWDDALNGLPGLLGSSMAETYELLRLTTYIKNIITKYSDGKVTVPIEIYKLMLGIYNCINQFELSKDEDKSFKYWDSSASLREHFRDITRFGINGEEKIISFKELSNIIESYYKKLKISVEEAKKQNGYMYPTYFRYEAVSYEFVYDDIGIQQFNSHHEPFVKVTKFNQKKLPLFLEGAVRAIKMEDNAYNIRSIYNKIKEGPLFDKNLKMYKLNESLENESIEIGRVRAFTPGWLENETIWLHMEYKYMLEILKKGLFKEFYEDFNNVLVPFFDAEIYGRSLLENCSFIASSANPDQETHGQGFVARLSGAAAEFLSIWNIMMTGGTPFKIENDILCLDLSPKLPGWLFNSDGRLSFKFLGTIDVTYINPGKYDTYSLNAEKEKINLINETGNCIEINNGIISGALASDVRDGLVKAIEIYFKE